VSGKKRKLAKQVALTFDFHQGLDFILKDLSNIDRMIPAETSRYGCLIKDKEAQAIVEARKSDLLGYIQTICRDHALWGKKLLDKGWRVS
jgi:hypothetical protein